MAEKRMFSKTIIDSDMFLDMPLSTQALYFHLSMRADDDGFLNNSQKVIRMTGASKNDFDILLMKNFIIPFENGICVIKHWRIHNYIRGDRYKPTVHQDELNTLRLEDNKSYSIDTSIPVIESTGIPSDNHMSYQMDTQIRLDKNRLDKSSIDKDSKASKHKYGEYKHVLLTDEEYTKLINEYGDIFTEKYIKYLDEYMEMMGKKYKSCYLAIRKWVVEAVNKKEGNSYGNGVRGDKQCNDKNQYNVKTGFGGLTDEERARAEAEGLL